MSRETRDRQPSYLEIIFGDLVRSIDVHRRPLLDNRSRRTAASAAARHAVELVRVLQETNSSGQTPVGSRAELRKAFAQTWQEDPGLAGAIHAVLTELSSKAFLEPNPQDFINAALGVEIKAGLPTPMAPPKPRHGASIGNRPTPHEVEVKIGA